MTHPRINIPADPLLNCPTCGLPAEITDRFTLDGAPAPVEHVKLVCIQGHWYTLPLDQLVVADPDRCQARRSNRVTSSISGAAATAIVSNEGHKAKQIPYISPEREELR